MKKYRGLVKQESGFVSHIGVIAIAVLVICLFTIAGLKVYQAKYGINALALTTPTPTPTPKGTPAPVLPPIPYAWDCFYGGPNNPSPLNAANLHCAVIEKNSTGAVANRIYVQYATDLAVDMKVNLGETGDFYYALQAQFTGRSNEGMYAGLQTNGSPEGGHIAIFSIWNALAAYPSNGSNALRFGGEGVGISLHLKYDWVVGTSYRIRYYRSVYDSYSKAWWWSATVTNNSTGAITKIGDILAPVGGDTLLNGSVFHERYFGSIMNCLTPGFNMQPSSVTFSGLASNATGINSAQFSGLPISNGVFATPTCSNYLHFSSSKTVVKTGYGISEPAFNAIN